MGNIIDIKTEYYSFLRSDSGFLNKAKLPQQFITFTKQLERHIFILLLPQKPFKLSPCMHNTSFIFMYRMFSTCYISIVICLYIKCNIWNFSKFIYFIVTSNGICKIYYYCKKANKKFIYSLPLMMKLMTIVKTYSNLIKSRKN